MLKNKLFMSLCQVLIMALIYFLAGKLSFLLLTQNTIVAVSIFTAEGFALAGILLFGRKIALGIFLGEFILSISGGLSFYPSFLLGISNGVEALIVLFLFNKFKLHR